MAAPTTALDRTQTVTLANPSPPTNSVVTYQGTPPTPRGLAPSTITAPDALNAWLLADPNNGAAPPELSGLAEADGTEVSTSVATGRVTGHSVGGAYTEAPNSTHPSSFSLGPELVTNGNFETGTGWVFTGGANANLGSISMAGSGVGQVVRPTAATITAGDYVFSFEVLSTDGGVCSVLVGGTAKTVPGSVAPGRFTGIVTSTASAQTVGLQAANLSVCRLDNFSVKRKL